MSEFDRKAAVLAANENHDLVERLEALQQEGRQKQSHRPPQSSPGRAEKLRKKNDDIREEITDLKRELAELRRTNVTQLYHTFTRLNTRLAYLNNENMSLRSVLANQRQGVRKATRAFHDHQVRRRRNEQSNTHTKQDIQMIRERRDDCLAEADELRREKEELEAELEELPPVGKNPVALRKKLLEEYELNEAEIERLERDIQHTDTEFAAAKEPESAQKNSGDLDELREEYKALKQELKQAKRNRAVRR